VGPVGRSARPRQRELSRYLEPHPATILPPGSTDSRGRQPSKRHATGAAWRQLPDGESWRHA